MKKENEFSCLFGHNIIFNGLYQAQYEPKKLQNINSYMKNNNNILTLNCIFLNYKTNIKNKKNITNEPNY